MSRQLRTHLWSLAACFVVLGLFDGVVGSVAGRADDVAAIVVIVAMSVGSWILAGVFAWAIVSLLGRLVFGAGWPVRPAERVRETVRGWLEERGTSADRRRIATFLVATACLAGFAICSVISLRHLIENRHGATLIAIFGLAATLVWAVTFAFVFAIAHRWFPEPFVGERSRPGVNIVTVTVGTVVLVAVAALVVAVRFSTIFFAVEGPALTMVFVAIVAAVVTAVVSTSRGSWRGALALTVVGVGCVLLGNLSDSGRALLRSTATTRHLVNAMAVASDFDRDGAPAFPFLIDCAPFDPTRHPLAMEIPDNGIDENCDGRDLKIRSRARERRRRAIDVEVRPNFVFVTFDATRADHVGFLGYDRPTTPHLDRIAQSATRFRAAFSQDSGTGPSLWSLFTGKTPFQVALYNANRFPPYIDESEKMLGALLADAGYSNHAVLCGTLFDREYWSLRDGFESFDNVCGKKKNRVAPLVTRAAIERVEQVRDSEPFLLWVHYFDPHHPYSAHGDVDFGDAPIDRYDEEIRYTDEAFGELWKAIESQDFERPTYFVFGADHGENFGEHGKSQHARTLYRPVTHIPMLVAGPGIASRDVETPVALSDLYPTILELAGVEIPAESTMTSLVPVLMGIDDGEVRPIFQENSWSRPRRHAKAVIFGEYHLIRDISNDVDELYDWRADPAERHNLVRSRPEVHRELRKILDEFVATTSLPDELR